MDSYLTLLKDLGLPTVIITLFVFSVFRGWFVPSKIVNIILEDKKNWQKIAENERLRADKLTEGLMELQITAKLSEKILNSFKEPVKDEPGEDKNVP